MDSLSALKSQYFSSATRWLEPFVAAEVLPYWKDTEEGRIWRDLLVELHDNAVWVKVVDASGWVVYNIRREQHVDLACAAIDRVIGGPRLISMYMCNCGHSTLLHNKII